MKARVSSMKTMVSKRTHDQFLRTTFAILIMSAYVASPNLARGAGLGDKLFVKFLDILSGGEKTFKHIPLEELKGENTIFFPNRSATNPPVVIISDVDWLRKTAGIVFNPSDADGVKKLTGGDLIIHRLSPHDPLLPGGWWEKGVPGKAPEAVPEKCMLVFKVNPSFDPLNWITSCFKKDRVVHDNATLLGFLINKEQKGPKPKGPDELYLLSNLNSPWKLPPGYEIPPFKTFSNFRTPWKDRRTPRKRLPAKNSSLDRMFHNSAAYLSKLRMWLSTHPVASRPSRSL